MQELNQLTPLEREQCIRHAIYKPVLKNGRNYNPIVPSSCPTGLRPSDTSWALYGACCLIDEEMEPGEGSGCHKNIQGKSLAVPAWCLRVTYDELDREEVATISFKSKGKQPLPHLKFYSFPWKL